MPTEYASYNVGCKVQSVSQLRVRETSACPTSGNKIEYLSLLLCLGAGASAGPFARCAWAAAGRLNLPLGAAYVGCNSVVLPANFAESLTGSALISAQVGGLLPRCSRCLHNW